MAIALALMSWLNVATELSFDKIKHRVGRTACPPMA
jgi:hypothetical protein